MQKLISIKEKNPHIDIKPVEDPSFRRYGRVHQGIPLDSLIRNSLEYVRMDKKVVVYEGSIPELEKDTELLSEIQRKVYGEMPIQAGLCYGWNSKLNGLEYHKGSEFIVAVTDIILLLGDYRDIRFGETITYDTSLVEAFYAEAGSAIELYAATLHYAPVHVSEENGFIAVIVLPRGTNSPLQSPVEKREENRLLLGVNKWLAVHPEAAAAGEYAGLTGENITINPA